MLRPFSSVSRGHSFVLCGLHDLFSLFSIIPLRFAEPSFRILLCFLSILSCFFFSFSLVLCVFTLSSHFVHNLFIINCYTIVKLREQPLNNENAFTTHIDKFFHNSLGVPGTSGHSSFYGKHFPGCTAFFVKKNVPMAHSRAEARLLQQPSTTAPSAHLCKLCLLSIFYLVIPIYTNTRPVISSAVTAPKLRESFEFSRLSPSAK